MSNQISQNNSHNATKSSFWGLANDKKIEIPKYQREYAQGRNNRRAEGIRIGLVNALYDALDNGTSLELDFIFGGKEDEDGKESSSNGTFHPVDGQQRLTILYLLHWYIFQRAGDIDALKVLYDNFSYATRTTSRVFCEHICCELLSLNWEKDNLSAQLKNMSWFTGAMGHDPTVKSMLVVVDCIHNKFKDVDDSKIKKYADRLKGENDERCPITFYYYDLSDGGITFNVRDLYIKMNARGLPLTDFEIFKAEIQKTVPNTLGFDMLGTYLGIKDSPTERVKLIGKFNNEYTNFFFNLINNGDTESDKFDQAMMNFINEIIRADFFCSASKEGVSQKTYREHYKVIKELSGKELYNFIRDGGKLLIEEYKDGNGKEYKKRYTDFGFTYREAQKAFTDSFKRIIILLDLFHKNSNNAIFKECNQRKIGYALFDDFFKGNQNSSGLAVDPLDNNTLPFGDFVARNALYAFLEKFSDQIGQEETKKNYEDWNRFVWKMVKNTSFGNFDEAVETLRGLRELCGKLSNTNKSLFDVLSNIEKDDAGYKFNGTYVPMGSSARLHFDEELLKAKLIAKDNDWERAIKEAEDYFKFDGQIWFLLDLAKAVNETEVNSENRKDKGNKIDVDAYSLSRFTVAFAIAKRIFNQDNKLRISSSLFERALLAVGIYKSDFTNKDHLEQMSKLAKSSKKFIGEDFSNHISHRYYNAEENSPDKNRYEITLALLREIVDKNPTNIEEELEDYIKNAGSITNSDGVRDWKKIFIQYDLLNKYVGDFIFRNCFEPEAWNDDKNAIAIYNTGNKRINSGELHSFALAYLLQNEGKADVEYYSSQEDSYLENNFPNRYFTMKGPDNNTIKVGYRNGEYCIDRKQQGIGKTMEEAYNYLCGKSGS